MSNDRPGKPANSPNSKPVLDPESCRRRARALLRAVRSNQSEQVSAALERFVRLRSFAGKTAQELSEPTRFRLKHALAVVAEEAGFESWKALLADCQTDSELKASLDAMYCPAMTAMMNRWFSDYSEAVQSLEEAGGYLLPYGKQYFITERGGIEALGLDPYDGDWQKIAFNWLQPADLSAWSRIWRQRCAVMVATSRDRS